MSRIFVGFALETGGAEWYNADNINWQVICFMKICAIVSGGAFSPLDGIEEADFVIACDKGCEYTAACGIRPDLLVGDFDSYVGEKPQGVPILDLPCEKDDTDTMAAVRYAVGEGFDEILLYCALGGRLDHLIGNIQAGSFAAKNGVRFTIIDSRNFIYIIGGGFVEPELREGFSLSVLSLSDVCEGVTIRGAKYELENATLTNTFPIGVSNERRGKVTVSLKSGILMIILSEM